MSTTLKQLATSGSAGNAIAGTALNALANNALVLSAALNNKQAGTFDGQPRVLVTVNYKFQVNPAANTGFSFWWLRAQDPQADGVYEDGGTAYTPQRNPDFVMPVDSSAGTSARQIAKEVRMPAGFSKLLIKNDGTGQALTANNTDNTVTISPITDQQV